MVSSDEVKNHIQDDIPIASVDGGAVALKDLNYFDEVPINDQIGCNVTRSFCVNACIVEVEKYILAKQLIVIIE